MEYDSYDARETFEIGKMLGKKVDQGRIVCLNGDLGVGKTVFAQGFASGMGINEPISSPTFTIVSTYEEGIKPLYHFDVYRIGSIDEMDEIGYEDYFFGDGVCLIEWSENIHEIIPDDAIQVTITKDYDKGFDYRKIYISLNDEL